jgi:CRP-like cAMP-binding protein
VLGLVAPVLAAVVWQRVHAIHAGIAHRDQEIEVLTGVEMFRPLPLPAIDNLALNVAAVQVPAGQAVFRQGDTGDRFYVIEDGEVDVIGDDRLIRTMRAGDGFGEMALLHDAPRVATVRARTQLRLRALDRRHFLSAVNGYASSKREADTLVLNRLADVTPRSQPTLIAA